MTSEDKKAERLASSLIVIFKIMSSERDFNNYITSGTNNALFMWAILPQNLHVAFGNVYTSQALALICESILAEADPNLVNN